METSKIVTASTIAADQTFLDDSSSDSEGLRIKEQRHILEKGTLAQAKKLIEDAQKGLVKLELDYPLLNSVCNPEVEVTRFLIEQCQQDLNKSRYPHYPVLKQAAYYGTLEVIKYIIQKGADITHTDNIDNYLIDWAKGNHVDKDLVSKLKPWLDDYLAKNNPRLAQRLADKLEQIRLRNEKERRIARNERILSRGNCKQIEKLLKLGVDTLELDEGYHLLHYVAKNPDPKVLLMMLDKYHCDPNVTNNNNVTPLHFAVKNPKPEITLLLLQHAHCNPNIADKDGDTPLGYAVRWAKNPEVIKILIEHGAKAKSENSLNESSKKNHDYIDIDGWDLLHHLRANGHHSWIPNVQQWIKSYQHQPKLEIQQPNIVNLKQRHHSVDNNNTIDYFASPLKTSPSKSKIFSFNKWIHGIFCKPKKASKPSDNYNKPEEVDLLAKPKVKIG